MKKIWQPVTDRLKARESCYFVAGSLCVDYPTSDGDTCICLHLDGKAYNMKTNQRFPQPDYITELVDEIYIETKGETGYYKETSLKFAQNKRVTAMNWWNDLSENHRQALCTIADQITGNDRHWESLTGREIEQLHRAFY